jgi:hypothetical protein
VVIASGLNPGVAIRTGVVSSNVGPLVRSWPRQVTELGVSPKQKERARQTFMKSAQYASFIDASTGRFVKPGVAQTDVVRAEKPPRERGVATAVGLTTSILIRF